MDPRAILVSYFKEFQVLTNMFTEPGDLFIRSEGMYNPRTLGMDLSALFVKDEQGTPDNLLDIFTNVLSEQKPGTFRVENGRINFHP
jgi:hypothetical protein